ncbi:hypothetical protein DT594_06005 [Halopseudomonas laoshanensis]|uniref:Uncharacterized protein n=1 Tax=Halopseudomonas laoshanensis TaxID=2268758 RepID=A0A7V7KXN9_9GAMM|nr:hypothetical protein [Halopseudomonas laoshanensis]KAA0696868.1 hypothetical protein DT594_06005 [Halopseudomonas laoshanensis]
MSSGHDFEISGKTPVAEEVKRLGFNRFMALAEYVRDLPYGRPLDSEDILAPLKEKRGTCSFKHRLLSTVADDCDHSEVKLIVGLYEMSERNTPGVAAVLDRAGIAWIPEAHCYLQIDGQRYDFTGLSSGGSSPFESLLQEHIVAPAQLHDEKAQLHQDVISRWAKSYDWSFEEAWALREDCIKALGSNKAHQPPADFRHSS